MEGSERTYRLERRRCGLEAAVLGVLKVGIKEHIGFCLETYQLRFDGRRHRKMAGSNCFLIHDDNFVQPH